jgi:signal transduction histidine kinase
MTVTAGARHEHEELTALADLIDGRRDEIVARWLEEVAREFGDGVGEAQLRNAMPEYLACLARALRGGEPLAPSGSAAWKDVAREHALARVRLGFDIAQLVREFILLRRVLTDVSREPPGRNDASRIADLIEAAVSTAVRTYVEARDYAARQKEAEHIAFITHELRNPLTAVKLASSRLRRNARQEQVPVLDLLDRNVNRLNGLVEGVLRVERLQAGKVQPRLADVELGELLEGTTSSAALAADAKGITLHASYDPHLLVRVDAELTKSAVTNVVENAVKYTDTGEVRLVAEPSGSAVTLHVWDNCPGLSPEELPVIFEPFERGRSQHKPGAGLGLAIARQAVEAEGGSIGAESKEERGCHFWITLPRVVH